MQSNRLNCLWALAVVCAGTTFALAQNNEPPPRDQQGHPNRNRPGPWDNDVLVYRVSQNGQVEALATFPRAGVSTVARLKDGRLIAAHQHFPIENDADFDKVAVHFSADEGRTWTSPKVVQLQGFPAEMRFPFDPTLVPLPDGRVRLYFTSLKRRHLDEDRPAIYSAISDDGLEFVFEPGVRYGVKGRPVIDCAVTFHAGVFHLFAPDNGAGFNPGVALREPSDRPRDGAGYHATSQDGLEFTRQPDVQLDGQRRWLGAALSDDGVLRFFGTGGPAGVWTATSRDGQTWMLDENLPRIAGADPGVVKLRDGSWLVTVTGPPRERRNSGGPPSQPQTGRRSPMMHALDANGDGVLNEREIESASAALRRLDRDVDGKLSPEEYNQTIQ